MTIDRLSYSTVNDYGDCGEKVRLKKVEKVVTFPSLALAGGSAVHTATANLDLLECGGSVEGPLTFEDAFEAELNELEEESGVNRSLFRVSGKASKAFPNKEDLKWWYAHGQGFVNNWRRFLTGSPYQVWVDGDVPSVEIAVGGTIGGAPVKGYIDRILEDPQGNLYIVDLKSGVRQPSPKQILLYRLLLREVDLDVHYGFYFMNRTGQMTDPVNLQALDDGATEYEFEKAWVGIQNGVFIPNTTSGWCSSCDVAKYCYAKNGELSAEYRPYRRISEHHV
jgi:hypothetical protein